MPTLSRISKSPASRANSNTLGSKGDASSSQNVSIVGVREPGTATTEPSNWSHSNSVGERRDLLVDGEMRCGVGELDSVQSPCKRRKITTENKTCKVATSEQPRSRKLSQSSINYLKKWIRENSPYPTNSEKHSVVIATGLTAKQVGNWFREARRKQKKCASEQPIKMEEEAPVNSAVANPNNFSFANSSNVYPSKEELMEIVSATSKQQVDGWYREVKKEESDEYPEKRGLPHTSVEYLNQWLVQNSSNLYPTSAQKKAIVSVTGLMENQVDNWFREMRRKKRKISEGKSKRQGLPQPSVDYLSNWFAEHSLKPFPTKAEKENIILATGLMENQVDNWFREARRKQREATGAVCRLGQDEGPCSLDFESTEISC